MKGYTIGRRDRATKGGGVLVYVPDNCRSWRRQDLEDDQIEAMWTELRLKGENKSLLLCNVYRPPNGPASPFMESLSHMIEITSKEHKPIVVMGDLNCDLMKLGNLADKLISTMQDFNMSQLISQPTRIRKNSRTLIDVLFTTCPKAFCACGTSPLTGSDHLMIFGELTQQQNTQRRNVTRTRSFKNCNFDSLLSDLLEVPWHIMEIFTTVDDM